MKKCAHNYKRKGRTHGCLKCYLSSHPWSKFAWVAKRRCTNKKNDNYHYYGGRGIEYRMTTEQVKFLWKRDKAGSMGRPSIDRINNDGHYEISNCRFIELAENNSLAHRGERHPMAKLTEIAVKKIISHLNSGKKIVNIAKEFSMSPQAIGDIKSGKRWKHIDRSMDKAGEPGEDKCTCGNLIYTEAVGNTGHMMNCPEYPRPTPPSGKSGPEGK